MITFLFGKVNQSFLTETTVLFANTNDFHVNVGLPKCHETLVELAQVGLDGKRDQH
jgi:hypothetical protein